MGHDPTLVDIMVVRTMLMRVGIVADLIDDILDYAEYWRRSTSKAVLDVTIRAPLAPGLSEEFHGNRFLLRSWPVGLIGTAKDADDFNRKPIEPRPLARAFDRALVDKLVPYPAARLNHPVRKVVFRLRSHDQGWTTHSTKDAFHDACTWFDVGVERFDAEHSCSGCADTTDKLPLCKLRSIEPPPVPFSRTDSKDGSVVAGYQFQLRERFNKWEIQRNRVAEFEWTDYTVTWTCRDNIAADSPEGQDLFLRGENPRGYDGSFVRSLKQGDVITVWGRTVQAGWENYVRSVQIDVYWAV